MCSTDVTRESLDTRITFLEDRVSSLERQQEFQQKLLEMQWKRIEGLQKIINVPASNTSPEIPREIFYNGECGQCLQKYKKTKQEIKAQGRCYLEREGYSCYEVRCTECLEGFSYYQIE